MNKLSRVFSALFLPEHCPYCNIVIPLSKPACRDCVNIFPETTRECYSKGGYPCAAPFLYQGCFAAAVKRFKFDKHTEYAERLAEHLSAAIIKSYNNTKFDYITCVPMHTVQQNERGFNQSEILAKSASKFLNIPYADLLIKHKQNEPQHEIKEALKRENVRGVYKAVNTDKIKGNNILVIDDIITTGYTLGECCKTLKKAGAGKICCAALCAKIIT